MKILQLYKVGFIRPFYFLTFIFLGLTACDNGDSDTKEERRFDYYPSKIDIKYAEGFKVNYFKSYKVVDVLDNLDSNSVFKRYYLVEQGTKPPKMEGNSIMIRVPLTSVSCLSTTQISYLSVLNKVNSVSGVGHAAYVKDSIIKSQLEQGWTMEITRSGQIDKELVLESNTSILMANAFDALSLSSLAQLDIPVIFSIEYLENSALARAEWLKFFALFYNAEKKATLYFNQIEEDYTKVKEKIEDLEVKPVIMFGSHYQGTWYVPGGESIIPNLFYDAGGKYVYEDQKTRTNVHIDSESLMDRISKIDKWGFVLSKEGAPTEEDFLGGDERMLKLAKEKEMEYFYCNSFYCDYFGMANLQPDVILKDLGKIFHPELFPEHQFVYFQSFK